MTTALGADFGAITTVLCDADGTLFPSEEPAFAASIEVTRALAQRYGLAFDYTADELRRAATGLNFRTTARELLAAHGVVLAEDELEQWVEREKVMVTEHLGAVLMPDAEVVTAVKALAGRYALAAVSSSALSRLDACFTATGLAGWFPAQLRFSAEDSLPTPTSKPDPAVYLHTLTALGCPAAAAVAVEDSPTGARSAAGAGIRTLGLVRFVPPDEQEQRRAELLGAGANAVAGSWAELEQWL